MKECGIGLLGFGTVGTGVVEGLRRNADLIAARVGVRPVLRWIADLDTTRDRGVAIAPAQITADAAAVIDDPSIDVIVELIGGKGVALTLTKRALERGKPVVTANKAMLAEHGEELFRLAAKHNTEIYFGASVGGGIPIIRALREGLVANRILSIHGILNGTCNYILTRMEQDRLPFDAVLREAQEKGYAEANPAFDIDGVDTAHKAVILAWLAYGVHIRPSQVLVEGIRNLAAADIRYAADLGYRVKLLAVVKRHANEAVEVRVHPALVSRDHMLASVSGVFNAAMVQGDLVGRTLFYGRGAGSEPTASTVIGDIADIMKNMQAGSARRFRAEPSGTPVTLLAQGQASMRHYLRLAVLDRPGTLGKITTALGTHGVSIASVLQQEEKSGDHAPVVIVTHACTEQACQTALKEIAGLDVVDGEPVRIRIEE
ncbi:MAG: homoserine dehydrogenase [Verrucomicrobia bacterium]|nr:homoserine dehydrogenase [Verrucomicrobiota bacterium]